MNDKLNNTLEQKCERHLTNEDINNLIWRYITNRNMNYAVLIDGKWGIGKTFYVKNILFPYVKDKMVDNRDYKGILYISLYGIKNISILERKICYSIIENGINTGKIVSNFLIKGAQTYLDSLENKESIINTVKLFQEMSNYILVFDDLERCVIPVPEILGYINELVEHKSVKTILIANQDEMSKISKYDNLELKYLSVIDNKEDIKNDENIAIIDNKINHLYGKSKLYSEIKEKLIGEVIYYNPKISYIIESLCENIDIKMVRDIIINNKQTIIDKMQEYNHMNIRTLKIVILKFSIIIEEISKIETIEYDEKDIKFLDCIFMYTLYATIMYKETKELYDWSHSVGDFGIINIKLPNGTTTQILGFKFVDEIIQYSVIDFEIINRVWQEYREMQEEDIYAKGSAFYIITNFMEKSDEEVLKNLKIMQSIMQTNEYIVDIYPKILCYLIELKYAGYDSKLIDNIIKQMGENIKKVESGCMVQLIPYTINRIIEKEEYSKIMDTWVKYSRNAAIQYQKMKLNIVMSDKEWGESIKEYCKKSKYEFQTNQSFFSSVDIDRLSEKIETSEAKDILNFIKAINNVYSIENFWDKSGKSLNQYYKEDISNIVKLIENIHFIIDSNKMEKVKKYTLQRLIDALDMWLTELNIKVVN